MQLLGRYRNGNYYVTIYDDGTKIRETIDHNATEFVAEFPENIDMKVTNKCGQSCPWCHEDSTIDGEEAVLSPLPKFIDTLRPYTEMALGGGNLLSHPNIANFLEELKKRNIITNITLNQKHFAEHLTLLKQWADNKLVYGIGVSLVTPDNAFIEEIRSFRNAVIHTINGITEIDDIKKLSNKNLKLLILGYKKFRRGENYYSNAVDERIAAMRNQLKDILTWFKVVSFDNLALTQLKVKDLIPRKLWNEIYMGDDGQHTMYVDLVNGEFAMNSTSTKRWKYDGSVDTIDKMFHTVKQYKNNN